MHTNTRRIIGEVRPSSRARRVEELVHKRKLIEVALPLQAINEASVREKSIRRGHPSALHLWWSRKPLATSRAVLFAQLVDDPSADPDRFPTEDAQRAERDRLHEIIERLVIWENLRDESLFAEAQAEIRRSCGGSLPRFLDPFAGGGSIPIEAQRLGLEAKASDLNPVSVLLNRALIEIPPAFADESPVYPGAADEVLSGWPGATGLARDIRAYGRWITTRARERIGNLYPVINAMPVIAWMWVRTVTCPNPACGIDMPLTSNWWLSKGRRSHAYVLPEITLDPQARGGKRVSYSVRSDGGSPPEGTVGRRGGRCLACDSTPSLVYIREQGRARLLGAHLVGIVAEGPRQRAYVSPTQEHVDAADVPAPDDSIVGSLGYYPRDLKAPTYGLTEFTDLFMPRQLTALTTFCDLVAEARLQVLADGGSAARADAIATYLGIAVSRCADRSSTISTWDTSRDTVRNVFARQAIPMTWDYAEASPFSNSSGNFGEQFERVADAVERAPARPAGSAVQVDAAKADMAGAVISTDPPYYDNIGYSDLSDFFYVWLRRSLRDVVPDLFGTVLVPKAEELVANPYRHNGRDEAKNFFEEGFRQVFERARSTARTDIPMTVYYAFKQSDSDGEESASTGWETLLEAMIQSGWEITSTWPMRSELANRVMSSGQNTLASSIVLSLRPRPEGAPTTDRRGLIAALEAELPDALRKLQQGQVAPVDLPQAAIGPGMAVFSRYIGVLEPDGKKMTVRSALARINEILDQVLNEQEGDFDSTSRFAIAWYRQHGYGIGKFGDADNLARARNTSVDTMDRDEILTSRAGNVQLIKPADLSWDYDARKDLHTSNWEALHHLIKVLERDGIAHAGDFLQAALSRPDGAVDPDLVKELAHLLFRVAEGNGWTKDALSFNNLVTSWPEILEVARSAKKSAQAQRAFEFDEDE